MKEYTENWRKITTDPNILDIVQHCHVEFINQVNPTKSFSYSSSFSQFEHETINQEIQKLLDMNVIKEVNHHPNEFISPIFVVPKKNGEYRMILNLKELNEFIEYHHFKMETFESALKLVKQGCFMASVDLRHAYYSVPIAEEHQIKLRFKNEGKIYQYMCLPNGISCAPLLFTKLMKPVYAALRMQGHVNSGYIDDSFLLGDSYKECKENVSDTVELMSDVGFMIHEKKSVLIPTKNLTFLGNNIDSENMIVTLPAEKVESVVKACKELYNMFQARIRQVARVLGLMVSSFSAVEYGPLFYRRIESEKTAALQQKKGDYDTHMVVSTAIKQELLWWIENLPTQKRKICHGNPDLVITCDASNQGWGAVCDHTEIGGRWGDQETENHINFLELLAIDLSIKSFCKKARNIHVRIRSDNTCAVSYIKNMGGKTRNCNDLAKSIWLWCIDRDIWISATYIPGRGNVADFSSRHFNDNVEWKLEETVFTQIISIFGKPSIDMFASRLNKQVDRYVSWKPDPDAEEIDAFSVHWSHELIYAFPPFSLVGRVLQIVQRDQAEVVLVAPLWVTQNWYTVLMQMLISTPRIFKVKPGTLRIPQSSQIHPLVNKLHLMVCRISGKPTKAESFRNNQSVSLCRLGERQLRNSTPHILTNGFHSVVKGRKIFFKPL